MRYFLLALVATTLVAVDIAPVPPVPPGPQPRGPAGAMTRPSPSYEVEYLLITPGDAAGLAAWAELAARGFHLITVVPQLDRQALFFERMAPPGATQPYVPTAIAADAQCAEQLRAALVRILAERQPQGRPMPAPAPEIKP